MTQTGSLLSFRCGPIIAREPAVARLQILRQNTLVVALLAVSLGGITPYLSAQATSDEEYQRPVSWKDLPTNVLSDQKPIWLFPAKLGRKRVWIPTALTLGSYSGSDCAGSRDAGYFRRTSDFSGFNSVFTSNATAIGTALGSGISLHRRIPDTGL